MGSVPLWVARVTFISGRANPRRRVLAVTLGLGSWQFLLTPRGMEWQDIAARAADTTSACPPHGIFFATMEPDLQPLN
jgi:hypothetical protein